MVAPYPETDARGVKELRRRPRARDRRAGSGAVASASGRRIRPRVLRACAAHGRAGDDAPERDRETRRARVLRRARHSADGAARRRGAAGVHAGREEGRAGRRRRRARRSAPTANGDEVIFETLHELTVTPARLEHLAAVDVDKDSIEEAPANVRSTEQPAGPFPIYRLATFADAGSTTIQITPAVGLEEGDLIRIGERRPSLPHREDAGRPVHDRAEAQSGRPTPSTGDRGREGHAFRCLYAARCPGAPGLCRSFRAVESRTAGPDHAGDRTGERDAPARLNWGSARPCGAHPIAARPVGEEIIPATGGDDPKPDWQPLDFDSVSPDGITFIKPWTGKVEKFEVRGEKSLWLRLALGEKIPNRDKTGTRVNTLKIKIESMRGPESRRPDPNLRGGQRDDRARPSQRHAALGRHPLLAVRTGATSASTPFRSRRRRRSARRARPSRWMSRSSTPARSADDGGQRSPARRAPMRLAAMANCKSSAST